LLTGQAGSKLHYKAGDTINVVRPSGVAAATRACGQRQQERADD
jgi:hypothetical protein